MIVLIVVPTETYIGDVSDPCAETRHGLRFAAQGRYSGILIRHEEGSLPFGYKTLLLGILYKCSLTKILGIASCGGRCRIKVNRGM